MQGTDWHMDPYRLRRNPRSLFSFFGAVHGFGGISGHDVAETTDQSPERVTAVQRLPGRICPVRSILMTLLDLRHVRCKEEFKQLARLSLSSVRNLVYSAREILGVTWRFLGQKGHAVTLTVGQAFSRLDVS